MPQNYSYDNPARGFSVPSIRVNTLLKKTFALLGVSVLAALVVGYISLTRFYGLVGNGTSLLAIIGVMVLSFVVPRVGDTPAGYGLVVLSGALLGVAVVPTVAFYTGVAGFQVVINALLTTGALFGALSTYAIMSKRDFSMLGGFLFAAILAAVVVSLVNVFFIKSAMVQLVLSYVIAFVSCGLILWRLSTAIRSGVYSVTMLAMGLLIDVYNLFISLLQIFGSRE